MKIKKLAGGFSCCEHCAHLEQTNIGGGKNNFINRFCFILGTLFFILGTLLNFKIIGENWQYADYLIGNFSLTLIVCLASYLLIGYPVIMNVFKNIFKGTIFDENFLMTMATCGAFAIGEYPEAVAVMLFYRIGEAFEEAAVGKSKKSIVSLLNIRADYVQVKNGDEIKKVDPKDVAIGSIIIVAPGEKIPLDGVIESGASSLDTSALTGESMPRDVETGDTVISGSLNCGGLLTIRTTKTSGDSTVTKILDLVENSQSKKTKTENFITKFAKYYTPVIVLSAVLLAFVPPLFIKDADFSNWIHRALVFLVVSCPCALVISIPLTFFAGIGSASKRGILIKGGAYLEALFKIDSIIFDKTGTLTTGNFKVAEIKTYGKYSKEDILFYCAHAEHFSKHPAAISICAEYNNSISYTGQTSIKETDTSLISDLQEIPGFGVSASVNGKNVLAGNKKLLTSRNISTQNINESGLTVFIALNNEFAGCIKLTDELKQSSKDSIAFIKKCGINVMMLSGDTNESVKEFASLSGIENYQSDLLPQEKLQILEDTITKAKNKKNVVFVGDGINDAPSLARSDIGIAIGAFGSDAAIEAADVVLMNGEPASLCTTISIAAKTHSIVMQNIIFALSVKAIILILGALGMASIWLAVFGDVGVTFIAILNSIRNLKR